MNRSKTLEAMARALHEEDRNGFGIVHWEALDANELAWYFDCAKAALAAYESHLQAEGMAVVPRATLKRIVNLSDCGLAVFEAEEALAASPYGKAVGKEASAERSGANSNPPQEKDDE